MQLYLSRTQNGHSDILMHQQLPDALHWFILRILRPINWYTCILVFKVYILLGGPKFFLSRSLVQSGGKVSCNSSSSTRGQFIKSLPHNLTALYIPLVDDDVCLDDTGLMNIVMAMMVRMMMMTMMMMMVRMKWACGSLFT